MIIKYYNFANIIIKIESEINFKNIYRYQLFESNPLDIIDFSVNITSKHNIEIDNHLVFEKINPLNYLTIHNNIIYKKRYLSENNLFSLTIEDDNNANIVFNSKYIDLVDIRLIFENFDFFGLLNRNNCCLLHSSYIIHNGHALLFCAPSGAGKSTQANLWSQYRNAEIINGDRTLIRKIDDTFYAFGNCFAGTSNIIKNKSAPLKAIILLSQSKDNIIKYSNNKITFIKLLNQSSYHKGNIKEIKFLTDTILQLMKTVPIYELSCTADIRAVEILEKLL